MSDVLSAYQQTGTTFRDMMIPRAIQHQGLMHSILGLSGTNIDYGKPYGRAMVKKYETLNPALLKKRMVFHQHEASKILRRRIKHYIDDVNKDGDMSTIYCQMLCVVVQTIIEGRATGEHRIHLQAYQDLACQGYDKEGNVPEFIDDYFGFHIGLDDIVSSPHSLALVAITNDNQSTSPIMKPRIARLFGPKDGILSYMPEIHRIRNTIRSNIRQHHHPVVDSTSLYQAVQVDAGICESCQSLPQDHYCALVGLLYKQMMWVYLWRTIYPLQTVNWIPDDKISRAVADGLAILASFPPINSNQPLLLTPAFILGCAAFDQASRSLVTTSIRRIKEYTDFKNTDRAIEVLQEVWRLMDNKDERSWDWQFIAYQMGLDFLAT